MDGLYCYLECLIADQIRKVVNETNSHLNKFQYIAHRRNNTPLGVELSANLRIAGLVEDQFSFVHHEPVRIYMAYVVLL